MTKRMEVPPVRFATSKGARIAYQQFGEGSIDLLGVPPAAQNIEMAWEWPAIRTMFERFGSFSRYLHFDKRGTGSSDRHSEVPGYDERVDDLIAVMDDAGLERAHILGISEGGPMALLFAHSFPERVQSLILFGTGPTLVAPSATAEEREQARVGRELVCDLWGTPDSIMVDVFAPSEANNQEFRQWFEVYERRSSTPQSLRELLDLWEVDVVSEILADIDVPVLVQHRVGDQVSPVENGRLLAERIPNAQLKEYEGDDHFGFTGAVDPWMDDLERWVTGAVASRPPKPRGQLHIRVLGQFTASIDDEPVADSAWGSRLARQICKRLIVARGWPVSRDLLIDQLWPEEDDRARLSARLSVHLSGARRVLGTALVSDRQTVRLDLDAVGVDLEDLHNAEGDHSVVAAYAGELLPDDVYEDWATVARDEARSRFVEAAHRIATELSEADDHAAVRDLAFRLIETNRHDDDAHRLLIGAQHALGYQGEAVRAYEGWVKALAELDLTAPPIDDLLDSRP